jgi:hypothetical protein
VLGDRSRDTTRAESHRGRREMSASVDSRSRRDVIMSQARPWEGRASSRRKVGMLWNGSWKVQDVRLCIRLSLEPWSEQYEIEIEEWLSRYLQVEEEWAWWDTEQCVEGSCLSRQSVETTSLWLGEFPDPRPTNTLRTHAIRPRLQQSCRRGGRYRNLPPGSCRACLVHGPTIVFPPH